MALRIRFQYMSGASLGYSIERLADGLFFDFSDGTFKAAPATLISGLTADAGNLTGRYKGTLTGTPIGQFPNGDYCISIHDTANSNVVIGSMAAAMFNGDDATVFPAPAVDPWSAALPGSYAAGTAGALLGANLDAPVSSRLPASVYAAPAPSLTAAQVAAAVWDEPAANHRTAGSFGVNLDAAVSSRLASTSYAAPPTAAQVATAVWTDATAADFAVANSAGSKLAKAASPTDPWSVALPGTYAAGTAGALLGTNLDARVSSRSTYAGGPVASVTAPVTVGVNNDKAGYALSAAGLDAISVEVGVNARQALSPILAACAGVLVGAGTGSVTIKGGNVTTTRILATTDSAGNRTAVTLVLPS